MPPVRRQRKTGPGQSLVKKSNTSKVAAVQEGRTIEDVLVVYIGDDITVMDRARSLVYEIARYNIGSLEGFLQQMQKDNKYLIRVFPAFWQNVVLPKLQLAQKKGRVGGRGADHSLLNRFVNDNASSNGLTTLYSKLRRDLGVYGKVYEAHCLLSTNSTIYDKQWWRAYANQGRETLLGWARECIDANQKRSASSNRRGRAKLTADVKDGNKKDEEEKDEEEESDDEDEVNDSGRRRRLTLEELCVASNCKAFVDRLKEALPKGVRVIGNEVPVDVMIHGQRRLGVPLHIVGLNGDIFGNTLSRDELRNWLHSIEFAHEDDLQIRHQKGRYYRIEAAQPTLFCLGEHSQHVMENTSLSGTGRKLLEWAHSLFEVENDLVREYISENGLEKEVDFKTFDPNLIQIVVSQAGGLYARHNDQGPEMCVRYVHADTIVDSELKEHIPYDYEQRVLTIVLTFPVSCAKEHVVGLMDEEEADQTNDQTGWCKLRHYKSGTNELVSTIITEETSVHIQGFGVQKYLEHDVKPHQDSNGCSPSTKRVILSFRTSAPVLEAKDELYQAIKDRRKGSFAEDNIIRVADSYFYRNVLSMKPTKLVQSKGDSTAEGSSTIDHSAPKILPDEEHKAREKDMILFMSNFKPHPSTKLIRRPGNILSIQESAHEALRRPEAVRLLQSYGLHLSASLKKFKNAIFKWLDMKHVLGNTEATPEEVRKLYGIPHSKEQVWVYNPRKPLPDAIVVEQPYKNKLEADPNKKQDYGFREVMVEMQMNPDWVYEQPAGAIELWLGPRGGNGEVAGRHGIAAPSAWNREVTHKTPCAQRLESSRTMTECALANAVFHLFCPESWATENLDKLKSQNCSYREGNVMYLGVWYYVRAESDQRPHMVWESNHNTAWLAETCFLYYIRPLYNKGCPPPLGLHNADFNFQPFHVTEMVTGITRWVGQSDDSAGVDGQSRNKNGRKVETKQSALLKTKSIDVVTGWLDVEAPRVKDGIAKDDNDFKTYSEERELQQLRSILSIEEYVVQCARIAVAASARSAERHVIAGSSTGGALISTLTYLCGLDWKNLGWLLGANSVPHPIRTYNPQTIAFVQAILDLHTTDEGIQFYKRKNGADMMADAITDYLFEAALLRLAGTVGLYVSYSEFMESNTEDIGQANDSAGTQHTQRRKIRIPNRAELSHFKKFLIGITPGGENGKMNKYTKCLYHSSLPDSCGSTVKVFFTFLDRFLKCLTLAVKNLMGEDTLSSVRTSRERWVEMVRDCISECDGERGNLFFLANLMVSDVEEVIENPFGLPTQVYLGCGGARGMELLKCNGGPNEKAKTLMEYFENDATEEVLVAMGLARVKGVGVVIAYNRRPLQITDADNIFCKMSVCQSKTTGSRLVINEPALNNLYDHPILCQWRHGFDLQLLFDICKAAVGVLESLPGNINPQFCFMNEETTWPKYCTTMDSFWKRLDEESCTAEELVRKMLEEESEDGVSRGTELMLETMGAETVQVNSNPSNNRRSARLAGLPTTTSVVPTKRKMATASSRPSKRKRLPLPLPIQPQNSDEDTFNACIRACV